MSIHVHRVKQLGDGSLEVMFRGGDVDAQYITDLLNKVENLKISKAEPKGGMDGFTFLIVCGPQSHPFTREQALQMLKDDQHIEVVEGANPADFREEI